MKYNPLVVIKIGAQEKWLLHQLSSYTTVLLARGLFVFLDKYEIVAAFVNAFI